MACSADVGCPVLYLCLLLLYLHGLKTRAKLYASWENKHGQSPMVTVTSLYMCISYIYAYSYNFYDLSSLHVYCMSISFGTCFMSLAYLLSILLLYSCFYTLHIPILFIFPFYDLLHSMYYYLYLFLDCVYIMSYFM